MEGSARGQRIFTEDLGRVSTGSKEGDIASDATLASTVSTNQQITLTYMGSEHIFASSSCTLCFGNYDVSGRSCLSDVSSLFIPPPPSPLKLTDRIRAQKEVTLRLEGRAERDKQEKGLGGCLSEDAKDPR